MSGPTVVQSVATSSAGGSLAPAFASDPTVGNTLYAFMSCQTSHAAITFPAAATGTGWSRVGGFKDTSTNGSQIEVYQRKVVGGDTKSNIPGVFGGSSYSAVSSSEWLTEILNDGTLDGSLVTGSIPQAGGTSSNLTTGVNSALVMGLAVGLFATLPGSYGSGWSTTNCAGSPGGQQIGQLESNAEASSGSAVNLTVGAGFTGVPWAYVMMSLTSSSSTETANPVTLALSGVSFSAVAADITTSASLVLTKVSFNVASSPIVTMTAALALGGVTFAASALKYHEGGPTSLALSPVSFLAAGDELATTAVLALSGISITAGGLELGLPGSGAVHFATFGA